MPLLQRVKVRALYVLNRLMWLLFVGLCANTIYVLVFMVVEHRSFGDSMWWGWVTGFTVGYGDIAPVTNLGRVVAVFAMVTDCVLLVCFAAQVTAVVIINKDVLTDAEQELEKERNRNNELINRALLASSYRMEAAMGCLPAELPEIPPYRTDQEIMAEIEQRDAA